jgi:hypothetical protein
MENELLPVGPIGSSKPITPAKGFDWPAMFAKDSCIPPKEMWGGSIEVDIHKQPTIEQQTAQSIYSQVSRARGRSY